MRKDMKVVESIRYSSGSLVAFAISHDERSEVCQGGILRWWQMKFLR